MSLRPFLIVLVALPMGAVAFLLAGRAWRGLCQILTARRWPSVAGQVVASGVKETAVRVRRRTRGTRFRLAQRYAPQVVYVYEVSGVGYRGDRIHLNETVLASGPDYAEWVAARYPVGSPVTVYYNPANPGKTALDLHISWTFWIYALLALILLSMAVVIVFVF
jgi:hypothetical protein